MPVRWPLSLPLLPLSCTRMKSSYITLPRNNRIIRLFSVFRTQCNGQQQQQQAGQQRELEGSWLRLTSEQGGSPDCMLTLVVLADHTVSLSDLMMIAPGAGTGWGQAASTRQQLRN